MSWITVAVLVLLGGYVLYVTRLFRIAFGQARQSKPSRAGLNLTYVLTEDREDCDYELLWDTQLPALELLSSAGSSGVPIVRMTKRYRECAIAYPELFDGSTVSDWLDALQNVEVAVCGETMIAITEKGRFILQDIERSHGALHLDNESREKLPCINS